jgi:hypothetical protein
MFWLDLVRPFWPQLGRMPGVAAALKQAGLVPKDFTRHMAFIWAYMFTVSFNQPLADFV